MADKHSGGGGGHGFDVPSSGGGGGHSFDVSSSSSGFVSGVSSAWSALRSWWADLLQDYRDRQKENWKELQEYRRKQRQETLQAWAESFSLSSRVGFLSFFVLLALVGLKVLKLYLLKRR